MKRYILGIDGGGTKTQAAIIDDTGNLCGSGIGGTANFDSVGPEVARKSLGLAVENALQSANLPQAIEFDAAFLGMAGAVSAADFALVAEVAQQLKLAQPDRIGINHDCRVALAGGLSGRPGIVLIVGTGSSCYGINAQGQDWRAGGWGHLISDEGSSFWLGAQAMHLAVGAYDGRFQSTLLVERVKQHFQITEMNDLMHRLYLPQISKAEVATLAPVVIQAARDGDTVAINLLRQGATELALCVHAVARYLHLDGGPCEITLVGGLLRAGDIFVNHLQSAILDKLPQSRLIWPELPPVLGACLLGMEILNITLNQSIQNALQRGAAQLASA